MPTSVELIRFWASHIKIGRNDGKVFFATNPERRKYYNLLVEYLNGIGRKPIASCPMEIDGRQTVKRCRRCGASVLWWWYYQQTNVVVAGTCPYCGTEYQLKENPSARPYQAIFRKGVEQKYGKQCVICGSTADVEIHHIIPVVNCEQAKHPELAGDPRNGIPLCRYHHKMAHGSRK